MWHPSLPNGSFDMPVQKNQTADYSFSIPPGPLYGQISVTAVGGLLDTQYIIHVLRVGVALNVSIHGTFNVEKYRDDQTVHFSEERRLQYQLENPVWYLPDLDRKANITIEVSLMPVCFAPFHHFRANVREGAEFSEECECDRTIPGMGDACLWQQRVVQSKYSKLCIFVRQAAHEIRSAQFSPASGVGNAAPLLLWLRDTSRSGKQLQLSMTANGRQPKAYELTSNGGDQGSTIETVFKAGLMMQH